MRLASLRHAVALSLAAFLVFGVRVQDADIQKYLKPFDQRLFDDYTPYFPGLANLETQEIFSPAYAHTKKIVFLGASAIDAIGCDYTWHKPVKGQESNVHYTCSVAGQMNDALKHAGLTDWRAFDLARNGSKMTVTLYVYARIMALKPDIVVVGDTFNYFMWENADANTLSPEQYAYMDKVFGATPRSAAVWSDYKQNLQQHGWVPPAPGTKSTAAPDTNPHPRKSTSVFDLLVRGLSMLRAHHAAEGGPRAVAYDKAMKWGSNKSSPHAFQNPDPGFRYFQGVLLVADQQRRLGGKTLFYFSPQRQYVDDPDTIRGIQDEYGGYLARNDVPFVSLIPMRMALDTETYDGSHHTKYGNRRIAETLLADLKADNLLPGGAK